MKSQNKQKNIILTGMPGAGKSTIGVLAAKILGMDFYDTDLEIQKKIGMLLVEIINKSGSEVFLKTEEKILLSCRNLKNTVISTGGSAVLSKKAMQSFKETGTVIYLNVPLATLKKRLSNITTRGIIMEANESIEDIFTKREALYKLYADIVIDCNEDEDIEKTVENVISAVLLFPF